MPADGAWGWHRLDPVWAERIVERSGVRSGELVVDLGAGTGALTKPLVSAGARVVAVELHPGRAAQLRRRFADLAVTVVETDLATVALPKQPFRVVANPPYGMSALLVQRLSERGSHATGAHIVMQRALGRRIVERQRGGGWRAELGFVVPRSAFTPRPPVDSVVLVLRRRRSRRH